MCLKKRLGVYLKKSIIVLFTFAVACSLAICSVSASTVKHFDLIDTKFEAVSGILPFTSTEWAWTSENSLLLPTFEVIGTFNSSNIEFENNSIYFVAGSTYVFNFWVELFNDVPDLMSMYMPDHLEVTFGNKTFRSNAPILQPSGSSRYTFAFAIDLEDYSGPLKFTVTIPWVNIDPPWREFNCRISIARQIDVTVTDQADKVLGGLNSTFGEDYNQPDSGAYDQFHENEDNLIQDSMQYFIDYSNRWYDVSFIIGAYFNDFIGFQQLVDTFLNIPQLNFLVIISICLGAFGLLLGTVSIVMRRS